MLHVWSEQLYLCRLLRAAVSVFQRLSCLSLYQGDYTQTGIERLTRP